MANEKQILAAVVLSLLSFPASGQEIDFYINGTYRGFSMESPDNADAIKGFYCGAVPKPGDMIVWRVDTVKQGNGKISIAGCFAPVKALEKTDGK